MNRQGTTIGALLVMVAFSTWPAAAQRRGRPAPPPSRYTYTLKFDAKSLPKGVTIRTARAGKATRYFIKNTGEKPLIINERYQTKRLVSGAKLVSGQVYHYFPNGVPMEGKQHLKGWQAPFGTIKETLLYLPTDPRMIYKGRQPGLSRKLPPAERTTIDAKYDGKPYAIKVTIEYHLNPEYDTYHQGKRR